MKNHTIHNDIITGNPILYKEFQHIYLPLVFDLVRKMGGNIHNGAADDIYTETILFLFEKVRFRKVELTVNNKNQYFLKNSEGGKTLLSTYLYEVARRKWLKSPDNPNNKNITEFIDDYNYEFDHLQEDISKDYIEGNAVSVNKNFRNLSTSCQMVILLKKVCKVKHEEIAEFRGITHGAARNLFVNCWNNLVKGFTIQRKETRIQPQRSSINIFNMLELFLDHVETSEHKWLLSELAEKDYYQQLPNKLDKRLDELSSGSKEFANQIKLLKEIISFLDEKQNQKLNLYKQDRESSIYFEKRNSLFENIYNELAIISRFILLLHHVANTDKIKIAEFFEFEDDISTLKRIHECKLEMAEKIMEDNTSYNELINNTENVYSS